MVAAESAHGEGDLLWLCVGGEGLVPAGLPYGAVLRVAEKWRSWVGAVDWVLDADCRVVAVHAGLPQHVEEVGVQAIVLAR